MSSALTTLAERERHQRALIEAEYRDYELRMAQRDAEAEAAWEARQTTQPITAITDDRDFHLDFEGCEDAWIWDGFAEVER